jgi:hypothetical protein
MFFEAGLVKRKERALYERVFRKAHEIECADRAAMFEEKRAANWNK